MGDHHCPFLGNCIGFHNHKYFLNLLFWGSLTTWFAFATMIRRTTKELMKDVPESGELRFSTISIVLLAGSTFQFLFALALTSFFGWQLYLVLNGITTIEFCERRRNAQVVSY